MPEQEPRTEAGAFLRNGLEALGFSESEANEAITAIEREATLETEAALAESTARLIISFRRWCNRRGMHPPSVDEYRRILDEAGAISGLSLPEYALLPERHA